MSTEQPAERPVLVSQTQLTTIREFLPPGATVIGGLVLSYEKTRELSDSSGVSVLSSGGCVIVFYTLDDHTIHRVEMCEVEPHHYELMGDTVVGHW